MHHIAIALTTLHSLVNQIAHVFSKLSGLSLPTRRTGHEDAVPQPYRGHRLL